MGLFGKKKEEKSCCCGDSCTPEKMAQAEATKTTAGVKVLGAGYAKCHALEDATKAALAELNMDTTIDHVTDFSQIAAYGVMTTPVSYTHLRDHHHPPGHGRRHDHLPAPGGRDLPVQAAAHLSLIHISSSVWYQFDTLKYALFRGKRM